MRAAIAQMFCLELSLFASNSDNISLTVVKHELYCCLVLLSYAGILTDPDTLLVHMWETIKIYVSCCSLKEK